jgi:hypothetical protein
LGQLRWNSWDAIMTNENQGLTLDHLDQVNGGSVTRMPAHLTPSQYRVEQQELGLLANRLAHNAWVLFR